MKGSVCIELRIGWSFTLKDHLPDDFSGTRLEAVQYLKEDIAQNLENYLTQSEILEKLKVKK